MARSNRGRGIACAPPRWLAHLRDGRTELVFESLYRRTVAPDFHLGPRRLEAHLIYLLLGGWMEAEWEGRRERLRAGGFLWLSPLVRHTFTRVRGSPPLKAFALRFHLRLRGRALRPAHSSVYLPEAEHLLGLFERLYDEFLVARPYRVERLRSLLFLCLSDCARRSGSERKSGQVFGEHQQLRLLKEMEEHSRHRQAPATMAAHMGMSRDYFARVFRNTFGLSPTKKLLETRMRKAAERLEESNLNVSQVAYEFGYTSPYLFSRQFKKTLGISPARFRKSRFQ